MATAFVNGLASSIVGLPDRCTRKTKKGDGAPPPFGTILIVKIGPGRTVVLTGLLGCVQLRRSH
jgi:hypothetical protein